MGKTKTENGLKLNYGKTILMGFAFMASSVAWGMYNSKVPLILDRILGNTRWIIEWSASLSSHPFLQKFLEAQGETGLSLVPLFIGIIMTFDNIFGVIFQPAFGKLSDHTHSRFGKRKPYIMIGAPVSALLFILIPRMETLPALMTVIILFVFVMSLWRAPCVALMPDLTPPALRSEGNAVINLVGAIGTVIAFLASGIVCAVTHYTPVNEKDTTYFPKAFLLAAIVMVVCTLVVTFFVKEPDSRLRTDAERNQDADAKARRLAEKQAQKAEKEALKAIKLTKGERTSLILMLSSLFFLFCGANSIETYFTLFATTVLKMPEKNAGYLLIIFAVSMGLGAVPAGFLGKKLGRKKTIIIGLTAFIAAFAAYLVVKAKTGQPPMPLVYVALVLGGLSNMLITVNTLPLVLEIGGIQKVGTFTGYYYTATFSAQIATPIVYGIVRMFTASYESLFVYCPICFALSLLCVLFVRHGEAIPDDVIEEAELADN